jgi:hypothetical protein
MRIEEACDILGVNRTTSLSAVKNQYSRHVNEWNSGSSIPTQKQMQDISIAYTKLLKYHSHDYSAIMKSTTGDELGENSHDDHDDDAAEMQAFMNMFRDLSSILHVSTSGIFGKIPMLNYTNSFMATSRFQNTNEDTSSDGDDDYLIDGESISDDDTVEDLDQIDHTTSFGDTVIGSTAGSRRGSCVDGSTFSSTSYNFTANLMSIITRFTGIYSLSISLRSSSRTRRRGTDIGQWNGEDVIDHDGLTDKKNKKLSKNTKSRSERRKKMKERKAKEANASPEDVENAHVEQNSQDTMRLNMYEKLLSMRCDMFTCARRGDTEGLDKLLNNQTGSSSVIIGNDALRATDVCSEELGADYGNFNTGRTLQHFCIMSMTRGQDQDTQSEESTSVGAMECMEYLCSLRNPTLNLCEPDAQGITVIHLAAQSATPDAMKWLLNVPALINQPRTSLTNLKNTRDEKYRVKLEDINQRCGVNGFTALHYASKYGNVDIVRLLIAAGALINIHAVQISTKATEESELCGKAREHGPTPLELVSSLIEGADKGGYTLTKWYEVQTELRLASTAIEAVRQKKEDKMERERSVSKDGSIDSVSYGVRMDTENVTGAGMISSSEKKKKKSKVSSSKVSSSNVSSLVTPSLSPSTRPMAHQTKTQEVLIQLVDAGYRLEDCTSAIDEMGADYESCIAWLVRMKKGKEKELGDYCEDETASSGFVTQCKSKKTVSIAKKDKVKQKDKVDESVKTSTPSFTPEELARLDRERKEEQRRINRAWNAKAEEEKKKADMEKRQKEMMHIQSIQQQQRASALAEQHAHEDRLRKRYLGFDAMGTSSQHQVATTRGHSSRHGHSHNNNNNPLQSHMYGLGVGIVGLGQGQTPTMDHQQFSSSGSVAASTTSSPSFMGTPLIASNVITGSNGKITSDTGTRAHGLTAPRTPLIGGISFDPSSVLSPSSRPQSMSITQYSDIEPAFGPAPPRRQPRNAPSLDSTRPSQPVSVPDYSTKNSSELANFMNMPAFEQAKPLSKRSGNHSVRMDRYPPLMDQSLLGSSVTPQNTLYQHRHLPMSNPNSALNDNTLDFGMLTGVGVENATSDAINLSAEAKAFIPTYDEMSSLGTLSVGSNIVSTSHSNTTLGGGSSTGVGNGLLGSGIDLQTITTRVNAQVTRSSTVPMQSLQDTADLDDPDEALELDVDALGYLDFLHDSPTTR